MYSITESTIRRIYFADGRPDVGLFVDDSFIGNFVFDDDKRFSDNYRLFLRWLSTQPRGRREVAAMGDYSGRRAE